ncbi:MAG: hypothetical protein ACE5I1_28090 [bacterium]
MVSYSKEAGTTFRKWDDGGFRKNDATVEITVASEMRPEAMQKLFSAMSRLHENFFGNPLSTENAEVNI